MSLKVGIAAGVWVVVAVLAVVVTAILLSDNGSQKAVAGFDQQGHVVESGQPFYSCWRGDVQLSWDDCSKQFCDEGLWKLGDHEVPEVCK